MNKANACLKPFLLAVLVFALREANAQDAAKPPYLNPTLPVDARVKDLIGRMTLEEKTAQLYDIAPAIPRLHVPEYFYWTEALHGHALDGIATVFPQAIGLAATWDTKLHLKVASAISTEVRAHYNDALHHNRSSMHEGLTVWSPNINNFRDPRWGRGQETYGEDPYLGAQFGVAFVRGMQGHDPKYLKTVATPKHFAVHSGPEPTRHTIDVSVSKHDMLDTYLPAFRATVMEAGAGSVMCSYNSVNGQPACANEFLLRDELRKAWHFHGFVVSDCLAIDDIHQHHHYTKSAAESAALSLKRGTDMDCDLGMSPDHTAYLQAVQQGILNESDVDQALERIFTARFRLGMFDPPEAAAGAFNRSEIKRR